jgi:hypothetical protein
MSREIWLKFWGSFEAPKFLGKNLGKYDDFLGKFEKIIWHHYGCCCSLQCQAVAFASHLAKATYATHATVKKVVTCSR